MLLQCSTARRRAGRARLDSTGREPAPPHRSPSRPWPVARGPDRYADARRNVRQQRVQQAGVQRQDEADLAELGKDRAGRRPLRRGRRLVDGRRRGVHLAGDAASSRGAADLLGGQGSMRRSVSGHAVRRWIATDWPVGRCCDDLIARPGFKSEGIEESGGRRKRRWCTWAPATAQRRSPTAFGRTCAAHRSTA